jgi:hypothetical protein
MFSKNIDLSDSNYNRYSGILRIEELGKDGEVLAVYNAPNTITYDARTIMTYLIAGQNSTNKYVNTLAVGTDSTASDRSDTVLGTQVDEVGVTYTFPAADRVQFEGILPKTTSANGYGLVEAGLLNQDDQLFARQTYGVITKTDAIQLKYIWTIIFS